MEYFWGHHRRFNAYANYFKNIFGERIQKVTINAGFTCPNRDGTLSVGGCAYCDNSAFNPSYCSPQKSVRQQIEEGIDFHKNRYRRANKYLAYFQAYSNTYAPLEVLKKIYDPLLEDDRIAGIVIGTRPDCVDEEKLTYFAQLAEKKYVILEYGVESCNNKTLKIINRGHDFEQSIKTLELTRQMGLHSGIHLIFGLPDETKQEWMTWTEILSKLPIHTIKFHQLQLIKNTPMSKMYDSFPEKFHVFDFPEYIEFIVDFLERLNPHFIVERFAGEVPPRFLHTQTWNLIRNDGVLQAVENELERRNTWQGKYYLQTPKNKH